MPSKAAPNDDSTPERGANERLGERLVLGGFILFVLAFVGVSTWEIIAAACLGPMVKNPAHASVPDGCKKSVFDAIDAIDQHRATPDDDSIRRLCESTPVGTDAFAAYLRFRLTHDRLETRRLTEMATLRRDVDAYLSPDR